jgi:hypothetical protein
MYHKFHEVVKSRRQAHKAKHADVKRAIHKEGVTLARPH